MFKWLLNKDTHAPSMEQALPLALRKLSENMIGGKEKEVETELEDFASDPLPPCSKSHNHSEFIPIKEFHITHLPAEYRNHPVFDSIQALSQLTCRVLAHISSKNRPQRCPATQEPYPYSGSPDGDSDPANGLVGTRAGSGFVCGVFVYQEGVGTTKVCVCDHCSFSGNPAKSWVKITVATARHVVFDEMEAKNTTVELFYDSETDRHRTVWSVRGHDARYIEDMEMDLCRMTCISHDVEQGERLLRLLNESKRLNTEVIRAHIRKYPIREVHRPSVTAYPGSECFPDSVNPSQTAIVTRKENEEACLTTRSSSHPQGVLTIRKPDLLVAAKRGHETDHTDSRKVRIIRPFGDSKYTVLQLLRCIKHIAPNSDSERALVKMQTLAQSERLTERSHPLHRWHLAVVVSHPHGFAKRISIGRWMQRIVKPKQLGACPLTSYVYDSPTCPGSSGGPVWLLHSNHAFMHVHSRSLDLNANVSSVGADSAWCAHPSTAKLLPVGASW